jgi:uncharacterized membrane protein YagU involved in acid resistance
MVPETLSPCSQEIVTGIYLEIGNSGYVIHICFSEIRCTSYVLILNVVSSLDIPNEILYAFFVSPCDFACFAHVVALDLTSLLIYDEI